MIADIITELCGLAGPSGFEEPVATHVQTILNRFMDETYIDVMGNVVGLRRCGLEKAPKLMLDAHMDEIGLIVTGFENGFARFSTLGGVDARMLPAAEIKLLTEPPVFGIVAAMPPHALKVEDSDRAIQIDDLYLDLGMTQEEAEKRIPLGTPGVYNCGVRPLGETMICGKTLDDRAGLAMILRALELLKDEQLEVDLYVLASTQEEVGMRGARTGAYAINPDWCIAVDVGHAKTPDCKTMETNDIGGGIVVTKGPNMNQKFTDTIIDLAKREQIKYQINVEADGDSGTNAYAVQIAREGVATALFELPLKYMHTPVEVISLADAEAGAQLMAVTAKSLKGGKSHA
jgi:putative aminopeptidase FrvX